MVIPPFFFVVVVALPYFVIHEAKESQNLKTERDLEITSSVLPF